MTDHEFTSKLGGREFQFKPLPHRPSKELRAWIGAALNEPLQAVKSIQTTEITDTAALAGIAEKLKDTLLNYTDAALDVVIKYGKLDTDREWIEDNALDSEIIAAFVEVVKRLFPFGDLKPLLTSLMSNGLPTPPISKN